MSKMRRNELIKWMGLAGVPHAQACVHVVRTGKDELLPPSALHPARRDAEGGGDDELGGYFDDELDADQRARVTATIVSYDLATRLVEPLKRIPFGVCVCDESHTLKTPSAARTKALLPLATRAPASCAGEQHRPKAQRHAHWEHWSQDPHRAGLRQQVA